ncbi:MAG: hypothetical protein WC850_03590 [Candidatus Gracilibacteria bacterium]
MLKKNFFVIILLTLIFSLVIFLIKFYFFSGIENNIEEQYIDRSLFLNLNSSQKENNLKNTQDNTNNKEATQKDLIKKNSTTENNIKKKEIKLDFIYIPKDFKENTSKETTILEKIILTNPFNGILTYLGIDFYKTKFDVRGKMKNGRVKLYGILLMENPELVSVFIHELGHYIDIYILNNINLTIKDPSYYFYDIAWDGTKTIKSSMIMQDFVSGYSMTNKYEDFAESFAYYILHNNDFQEKTRKSSILKKKYDFFGKYLFKNDEFKSIDFGKDEKLKDYYRDITKISINLENFLQYF